MRRQAWWGILVAAALVTTAAAEAPPSYDEEMFYKKPDSVFRVPLVGGQPAYTVIGEVRSYRVRQGDTLWDLARWWGLGYNEIVEANPGMDAWIPPPGATILLPLQFVLPCCQYTGVVVNIPEMRLYFYDRREPGMLTITTYPVGLGRDDWATPRATFKVRGKTVNPQWNIPESIRKEHIADRGDARTFIPGGAEDNPLGKYRMELTLPMYGIHGTNIPWGVGMQVSHGCIRLYPEDIERFFPTVPVGVAGEFIYQPVKVGVRDGHIFVEVHKDIYGMVPAMYREALRLIDKFGLRARVDANRVQRAVLEQSGVPIDVTLEAQLDEVREETFTRPTANHPREGAEQIP